MEITPKLHCIRKLVGEILFTS